jgi:hypothetical protein
MRPLPTCSHPLRPDFLRNLFNYILFAAAEEASFLAEKTKDDWGLKMIGDLR